MQYRQLQTLCGKGNGPGQFGASLHDLAVDSADHLYAVGDQEVKVLSPDGKLLRRWSTAKPGFAVAVAGDGAVYVGEAGQLEIFGNTGRLVSTWRDDELLGRVTAIGFVKGNVIVGDAKDRCLRVYGKQGKFLRNIGKNTRRKGFLIPNGTVDFGVDADGIIHVANPGKHRVERYTVEDELVGRIGRFHGLDPAGFSGCCNPTNVAVAGRSRIYVTEKADPRAKVYDFEGNLLAVIADEVFDPNCKNMAIAVDSRGRVYVADTVKLQIFVFEPAGERSGSEPAIPAMEGAERS